MKKSRTDYWFLRFWGKSKLPKPPQPQEGAWSLPEGLRHTVGTCRAASDRSNSLINSDFECHDIDNLFVVDSSSHPRVTSLWSGGTAVSVIGTYAALRIIKNHFT